MLKRYAKDDFHLLKQWVTDEKLLFRFSGPEWRFPLTPEQLEPQLARYPDRIFYIGYDDNHVPYAFGQLIMNEANAPRLGRLLVDEARRGQGLGQRFVKELLEECRRLDASGEIYLFVDENNLSAIHCYKKSGFIFTEDEPFLLRMNGIEQKILKMVYRSH